MLPRLIDQDLLAFAPDLDRLNIWDLPDLSIIPAFKMGCYAFVRHNDLEVIYIGSARAISPSSSMSGLRYRVRAYQGKLPQTSNASTTRKIIEMNSVTPLFMRIWFSNSIGDILKYEADAIFKHKPLLNVVGACRQTREEMDQAERIRKLEQARRREINYNPELIKRCPKCGAVKKCKGFSRHKYCKLGVRSWCKECTSKSRKNGIT